MAIFARNMLAAMPSLKRERRTARDGEEESAHRKRSNGYTGIRVLTEYERIANEEPEGIA